MTSKKKINNKQLATTIIIRVEQLYPFPYDLLLEELKNVKRQTFFGVKRSQKIWVLGPLYSHL